MSASHLMHLPKDVLDVILDHVWEFLPLHRHRTIKNIRLVCRGLEELATPLLLREWTVPIKFSSLSSFEKLVKSKPKVLKGIRKISIVTEYRPATLALSFPRFARFRWIQIEESCTEVLRMAESILVVDPQSRTREMEARLESYHEARDKYEQIRVSWFPHGVNHIVTEWPSPEMMEALERHIMAQDVPYNHEETQLRAILFEGFDEFRHLHRSQYHLISSRRFVQAIASAVVRIKHPVEIKFHDWSPLQQVEGMPGAADILLKDDGLENLMTQPLKWKQIEDNLPVVGSMGPNSTELPARLLSEVFVAIAKACLPGRPLIKSYEVCCQLAHPNTNYSSLEPSYASWGWSDFQHAVNSCSALSNFEFSGGFWGRLRETQVSKEQLKQLQNFLGPFLMSSQPLKNLYLNFGPLALHVHHPLICFDRFNASSIFAFVPDHGLVHLERLSLCNLQLVQSVFERFCSAIGDSLTEVILTDVDIDGESWIHVLDILRGSIRARMARQGRIATEKVAVTPVAEFKCIWGGELGPRTPKTMEEAAQIEETYGRPRRPSPEEVILKMSEYVGCKGGYKDGCARNPLLDPVVRTQLNLPNSSLDDAMEEGMAGLFADDGLEVLGSA
ncbi:hypothetical protein QBC38DRAFT_517858 [Podospora fimiseda]|uniref:Uncharacterized protein n=1 Tax=Podospora fimiseda TaxID=252190 RepID=A0AAN6YQB0_9PEZI|nr:hypothetical protein QBC38DRAFT_517858 [Podospora fimiseda]